MQRLKKIKNKSILLYSGEKRKTKNDIFSVLENFIYLTNLTIPKLYILITDSQILFYCKNLNVNQREEIYKNYPNIVKVSHHKLIATLKLISEKIFTLSNFMEMSFNLEMEIDSNFLDGWCNKNRIIKNKEEIKRIRTSAKLVSQGIVKMWKNISKLRDRKTSNMVSFLKKNIVLTELAYPTICSTGINSTDLHYSQYDSDLHKDSMVLLDIGYKYKNYCCDITRSFPMSGKFNKIQKNIYQIVLECQKNILSKIKPGVSFKKLEMLGYLFIFSKLQKIKIITPDEQLTNSDKIDLINKFFMYHRLGHSVGLEVHDVQNTDILLANMVYAIEPGIYFNPTLLGTENKHINYKEVSKYINIGGIRIEDTVLITSDGCQILSKFKKKTLNKEIEEIENIMSP